MPRKCGVLIFCLAPFPCHKLTLSEKSSKHFHTQNSDIRFPSTGLIKYSSRVGGSTLKYFDVVEPYKLAWHSELGHKKGTSCQQQLNLFFF